MFSGASGDPSMNHEFKQINRGFSLDQPQFSPHGSSSDSTVTCQGLQSSGFQMDSTAIYGSTSTMFQGLLGSDNQQQQQQQCSFENRSMSYPYGANYGITSNELVPSWSNKVPQFLRNSPPKQSPHSQLHFSNNAPFWNASANSMNDVRPSFFPIQQQFPATNFEEKPKVSNPIYVHDILIQKNYIWRAQSWWVRLKSFGSLILLLFSFFSSRIYLKYGIRVQH